MGPQHTVTEGSIRERYGDNRSIVSVLCMVETVYGRDAEGLEAIHTVSWGSLRGRSGGVLQYQYLVRVDGVRQRGRGAGGHATLCLGVV